MSVFFAEMKEQSEVKALIVSKYFAAWAKVILSNPGVTKIAYVDLFSGPGRYNDGKPSTPLLVLHKAVSDPQLRKCLVSVFNDGNADFSKQLTEEIAQLPHIETLAHQPIILSTKVGSELASIFESTRLVPTLFFVDPWGYKGLSTRLIKAVLKDWGCDCVFFFNFNRINAGMTNALVREHMEALFGSTRMSHLEPVLNNLTPEAREARIIEEMTDSLHEIGGRFVLPFRFRGAGGRRTSHYLILVTKHVRGYEIMKDIMYRASSELDDGVASFEYTPVNDPQLHFLFNYSRPLDDLANQLQETFAGERLSVKEIYDQHHKGRRFVKPNYKEALRRLEADGRITAVPCASQRPKGTLADHVQIEFPIR